MRKTRWLQAGDDRDFLIVNLVTTRSWGSQCVRIGEQPQAASGASTAAAEKTSRAESAGTSMDYLAFGFTELKAMPIRFRLKGGRSVKCSLSPRPDERVIRFDLNQGRNESTIVVRPGPVIVDGEARTAGPGTPLLVTASEDSLRITAGRKEVWSRD